MKRPDLLARHIVAATIVARKQAARSATSLPIVAWAVAMTLLLTALVVTL